MVRDGVDDLCEETPDHGLLVVGVGGEDALEAGRERAEEGTSDVRARGVVVQRHPPSVDVVAHAVQVAEPLEAVDRGGRRARGETDLGAEAPGGQGVAVALGAQDGEQRGRVGAVQPVVGRERLAEPPGLVGVGLEELDDPVRGGHPCMLATHGVISIVERFDGGGVPVSTVLAAPVRPADRVRSGALLLGTLLQLVAGGLGGSGAFGLSVGVVAQQNTTVVMPVPAAFSIWGLIYAALLLLAVRQVLPGQPGREVHRATGWWLAASTLLNAGWILAFSAQAVVLAQAVIVALLVVLAVALARLSARPAEGAADRLLLHGPVALYTGWVSVATVVGAATTGTFLGAPGEGGVATVLGALVLLVTGAIAAAVVARGAGAVPFAASVAWALAAIVAMAPPLPVTVAALVALVAVVASAARRVLTAPPSTRVAAAFG
jgi:translocator protein